MNCCVIIPAYEPGEEFVPYVRDLLERGVTQVLAVDDGSGPDYACIFAALEAMPGCTVLRHPANQGKGVALKTAFGWYLEHSVPDCPGVENMNPANPQDYTGTRQSLLDQGYSPCGTCKP